MEASDALCESCHRAHCGLVGGGVTPIGPCWRAAVTDGYPVPDRDAGTSHEHARAAYTDANSANGYTRAAYTDANSANGYTRAAHADANTINRYTRATHSHTTSATRYASLANGHASVPTRHADASATTHRYANLLTNHGH
jgi:hypothetical protein